MTVFSKQKKYLLLAATLIGILPSSLYAASPPTMTPDSPMNEPASTNAEKANPSNKSMKEYPEMTEDDCKNLSAKRKSYTKDEYASRKEHCKNIQSGTSGKNGAGKNGVEMSPGNTPNVPATNNNR